MKRKTMIPIALFGCLGVLAVNPSDTSDLPKPPPQEPKPIVIIKLPPVTPQRPIKLVPGAPAPIDAWVMDDTLSMTFLADFGEAEVTVSSDMSAWSVTETFDTADGTLLLTVDTEPGDYTITVTTSDASYIGGYSVE